MPTRRADGPGWLRASIEMQMYLTGAADPDLTDSAPPGINLAGHSQPGIGPNHGMPYLGAEFSAKYICQAWNHG